MYVKDILRLYNSLATVGDSKSILYIELLDEDREEDERSIWLTPLSLTPPAFNKEFTW